MLPDFSKEGGSGVFNMKNKTFKTFTFLFFCFSLFAAVSVCASAKTVKSGNFVFDVNGKTASVVEYKGSASTVRIPSKIKNASVTKINEYAFSQNRKVVTVSFPSTVKVIDTAAFNECTSLSKIILPEKLTKLGDSAFWFCTKLKTVVFGSDAKTFGKNIFTGCNKAITAYVVAGSPAEKYIKSVKTVRLGYRYIKSLSAPSTLTLNVSQTSGLTVKISPSVVYNSKLSYSSSDPKIVSVSSSGKLTALKCGKAVITCTARDASKKTVKTTVSVIPGKAVITGQSKTTVKSYRINWQKVPGATTYRVYRYDASGKKWVTLTDTTKKYYNASGLEYYSSDKYRVRAICHDGKKDYKGPASATFTAKVLSPGKVTAVKRSSSTVNSLTFSWKAVSAADGYYIYRYDPQTKKSVYFAETSATSFQAKSLTPDTEYAFVVRSYINDGKNRVMSPSYSDVFYSSTNPAAVTGLAIDEGSVYINKMTASWNSANNIDGYVLFYACEGKEKQTVWLSADKTSYELTELEPGVVYTVSIQSYTTRRSVRLYSPLSTVTASTEYRPTNAKQAIDSFVRAFNNTQNSRSSCFISVITKVTPGVNNPHTVLAETVNAAISSQFPSNVAQYSFENGKEKSTGISINSLMMSFAPALTLTAEDVDSDKVSFKNDGNGYRVGFVLEKQTPSTDGGKLLAPKIDTKAIEEAASCTVKSVSYDKTQVSEQFTKIQGSLFDNLKTVATVTVTVNDGENDIPLVFDIERTYLFSWD